MGSPFDALDAELSSAVVAEFSETCNITPRRTAQYGAPGVDPDRTATPTVAVLSISPGQEVLFGGDEIRKRHITVGETECWISKVHADALPFKIQKGDKITFPRTPPLNFSVIEAPLVTDMGDVRLMLAKEGI